MRRGYLTPPVLIILAIIIFFVAIVLAVNTDLLKRIKKEPSPTTNPSPTPIISPIIKIEKPAENWTIFGNKIPVVVSVKNFQLVDYQNNTISKNGQGHISLWLDDPNKIKEPIRLKEDTFLFENVAYSEHTLRAELVNNDDTPISPPVTSTVKFNNKAFSTPQPD